jgi:putative ABC transport system ATP-binding protein
MTQRTPEQLRSSPDTADPIVRATGLTKTYERGAGSDSKLPFWRTDRGPPPVRAVDDISLSVSRGEIVALAGPSGSGKSTLLHLLAGLERPDAGRVEFTGTDLAGLSDGELTRHRLRNVGIVFQRFHLLEAFSARANVALPLIELGVRKRERRSRASAALERVGLGDRIDHRPGQLSGGEQQRVAIARALITEPDLLIADEPTGELDTEAGRRVLREFHELGDERAVVLASHDRDTLAVAGRVVRLQDGKRESAGRSDR